MEQVKKTSKEWSKELKVVVLDPDGWDRKNYNYSFNCEKITLEEFNKRVESSTVIQK